MTETPLRSIHDIDASDPLCANCGGEGWVCEDHPEVPWLGGDGCCGAAGMPCECNPLKNDKGRLQ